VKLTTASSSAQVVNAWSYSSILQLRLHGVVLRDTYSWHGALLSTRDNFTITFYPVNLLDMVLKLRE